jgi:hypothetical protein
MSDPETVELTTADTGTLEDVVTDDQLGIDMSTNPESGLAEDQDDDEFAVDLDQVKAQPLIPKGIQNCTIIEAEFVRSQASDQPMWALQLQIDDGAYAERKLRTQLSFSPGAMPRTKKTIQQVFPDIAQMGQFRPKQIADDGILMGRKVRARVDIRTYQGQRNNNVRDLLPVRPGNALVDGV